MSDQGRSTLRGNTKFAASVAVRVLILFAAFNVLYLVARPLQNTQWTLYNSVFPGRARLAWNDPEQPDWPVVSEIGLPRLLADHDISRPKQTDEYRIVVLGSSEMWGYLNTPQEVTSAKLGAMRLTTPDGKTAHFYNLAIVIAHSAKDLVILHYVLNEPQFGVDLVIWMVNNHTFYPILDPHWLITGNPDIVVSLSAQYPAMRRYVTPDMLTPEWQRHNLIAERQGLALALANQVNGIAWSLTGIDQVLPEEIPVFGKPTRETKWQLTQEGMFEAMVGLTREHDVPLLVVNVPFANVATGYDSWLINKDQSIDVPLLNCGRLLSPNDFTNTALHYSAPGHARFAGQVAAWLKQWWRQMPDFPIVTECPSVH